MQLEEQQGTVGKLEAEREELRRGHIKLKEATQAEKDDMLSQHADRVASLKAELEAAVQRGGSLAAAKTQLAEALSKLSAENSKLEEKVWITLHICRLT